MVEAYGLTYFGFRLKRSVDITLAISEVEQPGGQLLRKGEFSPAFSFAYVSDPGGYEIEIWFE
jgi:predicted enzyme related to lactoylglutathione lyase